jgi:hypothetical protein
MNRSELRIRRVAAIKGRDYFQSVAYVECDPMEPTGLYPPHSEEDVTRAIREIGYNWEEYAVFKGRNIRREEYDDGAAELDGEIVETVGNAEPRLRFLSPYYFLIGAHRSAVNSPSFDKTLRVLLDGILCNANTLEDLAQAISSLPKPEWIQI